MKVILVGEAVRSKFIVEIMQDGESSWEQGKRDDVEERPPAGVRAFRFQLPVTGTVLST